MVSKKKKPKSISKETNHIALKLSLLTAIVLPTLFVLLKRESLQEKQGPIGVAGLGMVSSDTPLEAEMAASQVELAVIEFETPIAFVQQEEEPYQTTVLPFWGPQKTTEAADEPIAKSSETVAPRKTPTALLFNSRLEIGGTYTYLQMKPRGSPTFHGNLGGMDGRYDFRPMNNFYAGAEFNWKQGITRWEGAKRFLLYFDAQEKLGYTLALRKQNYKTTLFTGFGYRYMAHKLTRVGVESLRFKYNDFYVPVGVISDHAVTSFFDAGINFTWMPQIFSTVGIDTLKGVKWSLKNSITNFSAQLPFTFNLTKDKMYQLSFIPFYQYWRDGHSKAKLPTGSSLGIPGNTYNFYGADLNLGIRF
jgi:hypothetical protein